MTVAAVVIGRNEGARLVKCLASLSAVASPIIYVDSGSTDGSVEAAKSAGAIVVALDMSVPFTAARARNAGIAKIDARQIDYVQMVDGDCEMRSDWIATASSFLDANSDVAFVAGRLRERFPEATRWNGLADHEWDSPTGDVDAIGGIAMLRLSALEGVQGYDETLIAGEEPELCLRLRQKNWRIVRLADEMAWHDAAMTKFSQWWKRCTRGGHTYAEGAAMYGRSPERYKVTELRRALAWGAAVPVTALLGALLFGPLALIILLVWPLQVLRLSRKIGLERAFFLTLSKVAEAQGIVSYWLSNVSGKKRKLIEYK